MKLISFEPNTETSYCPHCEECAECPDCGAKLSYCSHCGEAIERHVSHIVLTEEKYNGANNPASHTATLIIDGEDFASAHIKQDEGDFSGDVAYLQLRYISKDCQTEEVANIIAAFAKWVRFNWNNPDKQSEMPTLVRLLGVTIHKTKPVWQCEKWVALTDATKIQVEHLAYEFTSKEAL